MTVALPKFLLPQQTQRVVLHNISWQTYQVLLVELGNHRSARLAYDCGLLEISMPSDLHEIIKHLLERIIVALTEELGLKIRGVGSRHPRSRRFTERSRAGFWVLSSECDPDSGSADRS